jgi:hypothetical protein
LEPQVRALAARPQPVTADPKALADLATRLADIEGRLGKAETAAAAPRAAPADRALADRLAALEAAVRPLADLAGKLDGATTIAREAKGRADAAFELAQKNAAPAAPTGEIEALTARLATLEAAMKANEARIATTAGADKAGRLAFVAAALRVTVERGDPFAQELAAARPLVPDAKTLAPLEPFAATGVPRAAVLARELSGLTGAMLATVGTPPREGGFIDRLQQGAERLVRIRPISEAPGDDPATVIGRADVKAAQGDISGARAEILGLPAAVRAPAQGWIERSQAREAALAAARDLADSSVAALAKAGL